MGRKGKEVEERERSEEKTHLVQNFGKWLEGKWIRI